jgi:hypothetical protein
MKLRVLLVVILAFFFTPLPAHATPGWCFENADGQQSCGATFEESVALTIADMNVRNDRLFAKRAADAAAAEAALQAEWRRQAADQAARDAEGIRISLENAAKNAAAEAARLAAEELQKNPPSNPEPPSNPTPPSDPTPPSTPSVIIDCALSEYYEHINCGGPRPAPVVTPQPEGPRIEAPRIEPLRVEIQIPAAVVVQKDESMTALVDVIEKPKALEIVKIPAVPKIADVAVQKPKVQSAPKTITPAPKVAISAPTTKKVVTSSVPVKKAPLVTKISCYKGKILKVISGTNPSCPAGYNQK